jgi:hypothetical protein
LRRGVTLALEVKGSALAVVPRRRAALGALELASLLSVLAAVPLLLALLAPVPLALLPSVERDHVTLSSPLHDESLLQSESAPGERVKSVPRLVPTLALGVRGVI